MERIAVIARTTINGRESKHYAQQHSGMLLVSKRVFRSVEARAGMGHIDWRLATETPDEYVEYRWVAVIEDPDS